jgi:DNA topoisomerase IB
MLTIGIGFNKVPNHLKSCTRCTVLAFEKAIAVKSYVDPEIIRSVLVSNSKQYEEETLINNLVTSGAGFVFWNRRVLFINF